MCVLKIIFSSFLKQEISQTIQKVLWIVLWSHKLQLGKSMTWMMFLVEFLKNCPQLGEETVLKQVTLMLKFLLCSWQRLPLYLEWGVYLVFSCSPNMPYLYIPFILTLFNFTDYMHKLHTLHSSAKLHFLIFVLVALQLCMSKL